MYLCLTHSSRPVDFAQCALNYLTKRYALPDRLKNPPPLESLSDEYVPTYLGNVTVWKYNSGFYEKPQLVTFLEKDYKAQHAVIFDGKLIICGAAFLEIYSTNDNYIPMRMSHPWFSGGHTVFPNDSGELIVSCSASDALLIFEITTGVVKQILRMPEELYGRNYNLLSDDDLRKHYIPNDLQLTHINCGYPTEKGFLVSSLIHGTIGLFDFDGKYREICTGFVGCHGVRTRPELDGFYFSDSCEPTAPATDDAHAEDGILSQAEF